VVLREEIEGLGLRYSRTPALNDSVRFIEGLADIVISFLASRPAPGTGETGAKG
jgi:protoheme ferro-lyase